MNKRIITILVIGASLLLAGYVYFGMYYASQDKTDPDQATPQLVVPPEALTQLERLQEAGAMSEEDRLEMEARLQKAEF